MIRSRPLALESVVAQALYIGRQSPKRAARFVDSVENTLNKLEQTPGLGHKYATENPRLYGIRTVSVEGFPNHLIFYRETEEGILFIHLLHGARDIESTLGEEV